MREWPICFVVTEHKKPTEKAQDFIPCSLCLWLKLYAYACNKMCLKELKSIRKFVLSTRRYSLWYIVVKHSSFIVILKSKLGEGKYLFCLFFSFELKPRHQWNIKTFCQTVKRQANRFSSLWKDAEPSNHKHISSKQAALNGFWQQLSTFRALIVNLVISRTDKSSYLLSYSSARTYQVEVQIIRFW